MLKKINKLCFSILMFSVFVFSSIDCQASCIFQDVYGDCSDECNVESITIENIDFDNKNSTNYGNANIMDSAQGFSVNLPIAHFRQETKYYCGPATTQQTIYYLSGSKISQSKLASELGTSSSGTVMGNIPAIVNKYAAGKNYRTRRIASSQGRYASEVYQALNNKHPVIIDIRAEANSGWLFSTRGHFCNISGITCDKSGNAVVVVDPNSPNAADVYTLSVVYNVNNTHPNKAYIW